MKEKPAPQLDFPINPWWGIWILPRRTIRWIVDTNPRMQFWPLVFFYGIIRMLEQMMAFGMGDELNPASLLGLVFVLGPVMGALAVALNGFVLQVIGVWLGGKARGDDVRAVLAWSGIPYILTGALVFIPNFALLGFEVFSSDSAVEATFFERGLAGDDFTALLLMGWMIVATVLGTVYRLSILVVGYAEVQGFTLWRSVGGLAANFTLLLLPVMCLFLLLM